MSSVERMKILGVRSFGTQAEDEARIDFLRPLTLIVGANGSGE
jgi:DNA repair exonuclease SbcCD ATPase subunit